MDIQSAHDAHDKRRKERCSGERKEDEQRYDVQTVEKEVFCKLLECCIPRRDQTGIPFTERKRSLGDAPGDALVVHKLSDPSCIMHEMGIRLAGPCRVKAWPGPSASAG